MHTNWFRILLELNELDLGYDASSCYSINFKSNGAIMDAHTFILRVNFELHFLCVESRNSEILELAHQDPLN